MALLTMALLTMAPLTMALLTMALLTMALLTITLRHCSSTFVSQDPRGAQCGQVRCQHPMAHLECHGTLVITPHIGGPEVPRCARPARGWYAYGGTHSAWGPRGQAALRLRYAQHSTREAGTRSPYVQATGPRDMDERVGTRWLTTQCLEGQRQ